MPITPTPHIWMNGEMVPWGDAKIHVLTHTLHYGTGVFEGIRAYETDNGPAIFRLTEHIERLYNSAKILGMPMPYDVPPPPDCAWSRHASAWRATKPRASASRAATSASASLAGTNPGR